MNGLLAALLRRGSSLSSSCQYFPSLLNTVSVWTTFTATGHPCNYVTVRGPLQQACRALAQALGPGCTTTSPTQRLSLPKTASFVSEQHIKALRSNMLSPYSPDNLLQEEESENEKRKESVFVYESSQSVSVKRLQRTRRFLNCVAVANASLIASIPTIFASMSPVPMGSFNVITCYIGALAILGHRLRANAHSGWWLNSYVHRLSWQLGSDQIEVTTITCWGTYTTKTIKLEHVEDPQPWNSNREPLIEDFIIVIRPWVSFVANGKPYHVEAWRFGNKELLAKLAPNIKMGGTVAYYIPRFGFISQVYLCLLLCWIFGQT